jgi:hypothetical protein
MYIAGMGGGGMLGGGGGLMGIGVVGGIKMPGRRYFFIHIHVSISQHTSAI